MGYRVCKLLLGLSQPLVVVTLPGRDDLLDEIRQHGVEIILGNARNESVLRQARLADARAIIACTSNDLTNIEIALDARRLMPKLRVVVRMFDQILARRLEEAIGIDRALAMSALSAPAFASASLGETIHGSFDWDGNEYVIGALEPELVDEASPLIASGRLHQVGGTDQHGDPIEVVCHQSDFLRLKKLITPDLLHEKARTSSIARVVENWLYGLSHMRDILRSAPRQIRGLMGLIVVLVVVSVFIFWWGMRLSPVDAIYFVVTTVTTTGYGDITPRDAQAWLKVYACLLMILGSAAVATLYSIITDFVVASRFERALGRQRVPQSGHVVVVGLGNVGLRTTLELHRMGVKVVAVDLNLEADRQSSLPADVPFVQGDGRDMATLERSGIKGAVALVAATEDDTVNLSVGLSARQINPGIRTVLRLFDGEFATKVQSALQVDVALSASRIAAPTFVGAALFDGAIKCYVNRDEFYVIRHRTTEDGGPGLQPLRIGGEEPDLEIAVFPLSVPY